MEEGNNAGSGASQDAVATRSYPVLAVIWTIHFWQLRQGDRVGRNGALPHRARLQTILNGDIRDSKCVLSPWW